MIRPTATRSSSSLRGQKRVLPGIRPTATATMTGRGRAARTPAASCPPRCSTPRAGWSGCSSRAPRTGTPPSLPRWGTWRQPSSSPTTCPSRSAWRLKRRLLRPPRPRLRQPGVPPCPRTRPWLQARSPWSRPSPRRRRGTSAWPGACWWPCTIWGCACAAAPPRPCWCSRTPWWPASAPTGPCLTALRSRTARAPGCAPRAGTASTPTGLPAQSTS
mmetsp:Transcript_282/g.894  ORF Transcript_282/g.894 Transcript_282/m.894 type:complete len:217 (+) Transcript_282:2314-2964(+)